MLKHKRLPVHKLRTNAKELSLGGAKVFHLPDWHNLSHPERLKVIRQVAMMRARDPRIAKLAVQILKKNGARPRQYKDQAAALLKWVQDPKNVYYVNEPGERLQDPIYTIKEGHGDCFAEDTLVLRQDGELVPIQSVRVGDRIWGKDRWSTVVNFWEKGRLEVTEVGLNNGSVLRLTEGHKVYVTSCCGPKEKGHGPLCATESGRWKQCSKRYGTEEVRISLSELREGMQLVQPEKIEQPEARGDDPEGDWLLGAFIAEGWSEDSRAMLSGKDGHWKEATKHRAKAYAEAKGWSTRWHEKYLAINAPEAAAWLGECGKGALNKRIPSGLLCRADLAALDDGLKLDASQNSRGEGWTFGTVSRTLAVQYRVLQRMLGRSTSMRMVTDHGGFGTNPIYRVGVRNPSTNTDRRLLVRSIQREVEEVPCYDIATDDHYVYLPEADCTVSNCDDQILLLTCFFESIGLPWRLVLSGRQGAQKLRHIEGQPLPPGEVAWTHIYCMVGTPPYRPVHWFFCEPTVEGVPLGWDVISGDHSYLPEMSINTPSGSPKLMLPPPAARRTAGKLPPPSQQSPAYQEALGDVYGASGSLVGGAVGATVAQAEQSGTLDWTKIGQAVVTGVLVSVGTSLLLNWINGEGMWEGQGPITKRVRQVVAPTLQASAFVAPIFKE